VLPVLASRFPQTRTAAPTADNARSPEPAIRRGTNIPVSEVASSVARSLDRSAHLRHTLDRKLMHQGIERARRWGPRFRLVPTVVIAVLGIAMLVILKR
jgi:hypothetical protein